MLPFRLARSRTAAERLRPAYNGVVAGLVDQMTVDHTPPREACGVFGVFGPGLPVAHLTFDGLYALQHRGQESAGMAVSDGTDMVVVKDMGLVTNVFNEYKLAGLEGHLAIGHTPLLDDGVEHVAQRPARLPRRSGDERRSPSATTAT